MKTTNDGASLSMSADELERAVRYSRTREWLMLAAMLYGWLAQALVLRAGVSAALRDVAQRLTDREWLADAIYTGLYGLVGRALSLPLDYYRDYVVEHRYGLSNLGLGGWLAEEAKKSALSLVFEAPLTAVVYATIRRSPRRWWLLLSGIALPFTVLLAQLYPVLIAPIFNRFVPLADEALAARVRSLAGRAGVRVADVMQMDMSRQTRKANAFFAGLGPTKRIALGDTLVQEFTPDEVEVIVAHELGHQVHGDIWKGVALGSVMTLGSAYLLSRIAPSLIARYAPRTGVDSIEDVASMPLLGLVLGVVSTLAMPLANGFSRRFVERPADRFALELTGRPDAFVSGMERLARLNLADPDPPALVRLLLHSHPTVAERIRMARGVAAR